MSSSTSSSDPFRLLLRALGFGACVGALLLVALYFGPHASRVDYMGAVAAKHARLRSLPSPKVVIIGGSNAAFGMDSERLGKALCRPVVNMSIHASLGFKFMVEEVKAELDNGDLVIAALEHSGYSKPVKDNDLHILTVDRFPEALGFVPWTTRPRLVLGVGVMRQQAAWKVLSGAWKDDSPAPVYRASGFNGEGDLVSHLGLPVVDPDAVERTEYHEPIIASEFWSIAQELADSVKAHKGELVFILPAIARSSYRPEVDRTIRTALAEHGYTVLGTEGNNVQPDSSFHDTHYHLRAVGRQLRTATLIEDLCRSGTVQCCPGGEGP